ncbi:unnamed protein product [Rotaria sp. Silwood2]|nr:unnamed protein product [Rotaria sp. Silwood2]
MSTIFRSEEMTLCQLFLQPDAAYACISELGELGIVQFRDLNPNVNSFQRKFVNEVRRCEEMERKLRFLETEIKKDELPIYDPEDNPDAPKPREMIDLEATFEKLDHELKEINTNADALLRNFNELTELKHNLQMTQGFFDEAQANPVGVLEDISAEREIELGGQSTAAAGMKLGFITGVIPRERMVTFERMLWRVCRGNVFVKQADISDLIEDPLTGEKVHKTVFVVFFQGEQLKNRVQKICEGFRANIYPCPENPYERRELAMGVMTRLDDLTVVLSQTQDHRQRVLAATSRNLRTWQIKVKKIKAIYHTMNMFNNDVARKCFIAECWAPVSELDRIQLALRKGSIFPCVSTQAPSLLIQLINMILLSYPSEPESSRTFYSGQQGIQTALIILAVICIPWMLLGKPIYRIIMNKRRANRGIVLDVDVRDTDTDEMLDDEHLHQQHHQTEVEMSEVWVEQGIHTIEYFLGCISHTASYLRLWALSLAHAQLSEVLWQMVLHIGLSMNGYIGCIASFLVFMPWSCLTVFILLLMEGLSAFLHALRLHWVEFQSKFYKGEGYPFIPFSFRLLLDEVPIEG